MELDKQQLDNLVVEILGVNHPISDRIMNGDPTLEVIEVWGATLSFLMAEIQYLNNEIEKLKEKPNG